MLPWKLPVIEVKHCTSNIPTSFSTVCVLYPFRKGIDPKPRVQSEAQKQVSKQNFENW